MEDGEGRHRGSRVHNHPSALASQFNSTAAAAPPVAPRNNRWSQAIARGAFDDDDAAQVAGIDAMANGNLARQRRAAEAAYNHVSYGYTEKSLGRDRKGHAAPMTALPTRNIDMKLARNGARRAGPDPRGSNPPRQQNASPLPQPPAKALPRPVQVQPAAAQLQTAPRQPAIPPVDSTTERQVPQDNSLTPQDQDLSRVWPAGASFVFQSPAVIQSTAFPQRRNIPGTVFLVTGREASDDMVVFRFNSEDVSEVRHKISEYTDYMTREKGLLLLFTVEGGMKMFYAVTFESYGTRESFILSLRKLVDRPKQKTQTVTSFDGIPESTSAKASKSTTQSELRQSVLDIEPLEPLEKAQPVQQAIAATEVPMKTQISQDQQETIDHPKYVDVDSASTKMVKDPTLVAPTIATTAQETKADVISRAKPVTTVDTLSSGHNDPAVISPQVINEIVREIVPAMQYMRHCHPDESGFDVIRTVIRSHAQAIVAWHYPDFDKMSVEVKKHMVDVQCRPAVERAFLRKLASNPSLVLERTSDSRRVSPQKDAEVPAKVPQKRSPFRYQMSALLALRDKAVMPDAPLRHTTSSKPRPVGLRQGPSQSHPRAPNFQDHVGQASATRTSYTKPPSLTTFYESQSDKSTEPFDDMARLSCPQERQVSAVEQHRNTSAPALAAIQGKAQGTESGLPGNTASDNQISAVGDLQGASKAPGFGGPGLFPATPFKITNPPPHSASVDTEVENIASFLSGGKKNVFPSPPSDSMAKVHNYSKNAHHGSSNARIFSDASVRTSSYSQELSSLFTGELTQQGTDY